MEILLKTGRSFSEKYYFLWSNLSSLYRSLFLKKARKWLKIFYGFTFWEKGIPVIFFISVSYCPINTKRHEKPKTKFYILISYYTARESCLVQSESILSVLRLYLQAHALVKGCTTALQITAVCLYDNTRREVQLLSWAVWDLQWCHSEGTFISQITVLIPDHKSFSFNFVAF